MRYFPLLVVPLVAALLWVEAPAPARGSAQQDREAKPDDTPAVPDGMEVQARGPVHEAYAEPTNGKPEASPAVEKAPPDPIEEVPPENKPEGENVIWVPGYWAWEAESKEHLWVSGFWRVAPPGRTWTPGHWQKTDDGHQWVAGYWAEAPEKNEAQGEVELLPPPPETIDRGPSVPAPAADYQYVPGIWVHRTSRFVWRPGFWVRHRPGWVWINACYRWTPAGYIFVPSYYDVPMLERGLLCAPVRFVRPIYARRGFVYRPIYFVRPDFLCGSLFITARRPRFYFGNYFERGYRDRYIAWHSYRVHRTFDANFGYYRLAYARYPAWERGLTALYAGRYNGDIPRPPVTLVQQTKVINNITVNKTTNVHVSKTVNITNVQNSTVLRPFRKAQTVQVSAMASLAGLKPTEVPKAVRREVKVVEVSAARRKEELQQISRMRAIAAERRAVEAKLAAKAPVATLKAPVRARIDLPKTTPPPRKIETTIKPPARPDRPKIDEKAKPPIVVPKPKEKDKIKPPPPKEKDKIKPPPKPKEKDKPKPPPPPPKEKDKPKPPPPPKEKDKGPPPRPKEKEKPKPPLPPPPPPPKPKDKPPPPPKPKEKEKPPRPAPALVTPPPKPVAPPPPKVVAPPPKPVTPPPPPPRPGNPPKEKR